MSKTILAVMIGALTATAAFAGPPGDNTNGSTTTTVEAVVRDFDACALRAVARSLAAAKDEFNLNTADSDANYSANASVIKSAEARALAFALASQRARLRMRGATTLDLTRHGINGSVHQVALTGHMGSSQYYVSTSRTRTEATAEADAEANVEVEVLVDAIAQALADFNIGISIDIPLVGTASAGVEFDAEAVAAAEATADGSADASGSSEASGEASGSTQARGRLGAGTSSTVYVQGANIEEFETDLSLRTRALNQVSNSAMASALADAYATAIAYQLAEAAVEARAAAEGQFCYDIIIASDCVALDTDERLAQEMATVIVNVVTEIEAAAASWADAISRMLTRSNAEVTLTAAYENLPGTEDLLEVAAVGDVELQCRGEVTVQAGASADAGD